MDDVVSVNWHFGIDKFEVKVSLIRSGLSKLFFI